MRRFINEYYQSLRPQEDKVDVDQVFPFMPHTYIREEEWNRLQVINDFRINGLWSKFIDNKVATDEDR